MTEDEYKDAFDTESKQSEKNKIALEKAIDAKKFEIDLYWKKAAYFWTLIAASFAGFLATINSSSNEKDFISFVIGCVGFFFTFSWYLSNRGSKYWQENWENHIALLENGVIGPLHKTILHRPPEADLFEKYLTGPLPASSSKINQWTGFFTILVWITLIATSLPEFNANSTISFRHVFVGFLL